MKLANHGKHGVNELFKIITATFAVAFGFVTAALVFIISCMLSGKGNPHERANETVEGIVQFFFYIMFAGPYVVASSGVELWREAKLSNQSLAVCLLVSAAWSFCLGVIVVHLMMLFI